MKEERLIKDREVVSEGGGGAPCKGQGGGK